MKSIAWVGILTYPWLFRLTLCQPENEFPAFQHTAATYTEQVVVALDQLVTYYSQHFSEMNVDGVFGLRVVQGTLKSLSSGEGDFVPLDSYPRSLVSRLNHIRELIESTIGSHLHEVQLLEPEYFKEMQPLINREFSPRYVKRSVNSTVIWKSPLSEKETMLVFGEKESDSCFTQLFGAGGSASDCRMSSSCVEMMTRRGLWGYSLLHQVLYSIVIDQKPSCQSQWAQLVRTHGFSDADAYQIELCSNSHHQMLKLFAAANGPLSSSDEDLLFEHLFVCPSIGFQQFIVPKFLQALLEAQDSSGCFKEESPRWGGRALLREKELQDSCLAHKTAVAAAALSQYLLVLLPLSAEESHARFAPLSIKMMYLIIPPVVVLFIFCRRLRFSRFLSNRL